MVSFTKMEVINIYIQLYTKAQNFRAILEALGTVHVSHAQQDVLAQNGWAYGT